VTPVPPTPAIERTWHAIAPEGSSEGPVTFSVGPPQREPGGEWSVVVRLDTLDPTPRKIFGVDGWQATALGMQFVAAQVRGFSERGWQFFWSKGGDRAGTEDA
jgi:hypothetical protein